MTPKLCAVLVSLPLLVGATGARAAGIVQNTTLTPTAGISLDTIIFRPDNAPRPVLVARAGGATSTSSIATQGDAAINAGYVFVYQQMRGFSPSTGNTFTASLASGDPLNEGDDGRSLLTWIKSQSWSNGHVAIQGASHSGIAADLAAPGASPPLTGLDEEYATDDLRHQGLYQGGVIRMDIANVLTTGSLTLLPSWETWATEPSYIDDDAQIATIGAVGLHRGGWFDAFGQGTLDTFSRIQDAGGAGANGDQKIVMGPWTHGKAAATTVGALTFPNSDDADSPFPALYAAWQEGSLGGTWTAWNAFHAVNVYEMGDPSYPGAGNKWLTFDVWPPTSVSDAALYFSAGGSLSVANGTTSSSVSFVSDPSSPCPTAGGTNNLSTTNPGGPEDQSAIEARSDVVVFTSPVQSMAMEIIGHISADVWIETNVPDVDVVVRMTDVYPRGGGSMLMAQGIQRARYRNGPCASLLTASTPTLVRVDMLSTALALAPGHALRVIVSASAAPLYAVNPQNGDSLVGGNPNQIATIDVLFGGSTPSTLILPVVSSKLPVVDAGAGPTTCPDASSQDAASAQDGSPPDDASARGGSAQDAASARDGSTVARDGGAETDPGAESGGTSPGGCACNASAKASLPPSAALFLLVGARLRRSRRRRPGRSAP